MLIAPLQESEAYLRQLEADGETQNVYGTQTELVLPEAAFVVKTKDKNSGQKIYINICTSAKVEQATQEKVEGKQASHT